MTTLQRIANRFIVGVHREWWENPLRAGWRTAYLLLLVMAAVLFIRRLAGSFQHPPTGLVLMSVGLAAVVWCAVLRRLGPQCGIETLQPRASWLLSGLMSVSCLLLLLTVSFPQAPLAGVIAIWSGIVAVEVNWWTIHLQVHASGRAAAEPVSMPGAAADHRTIHASSDDVECHEGLPSDVTQQLTRTRGTTAGETIYGSLRADFAAQERARAVHVTFCPPLKSTPEFCVEQADGPDAHIEVAQLAPYGARLEIKLDRPATEDSSIVLQFEAVCEK